MVLGDGQEGVQADNWHGVRQLVDKRGFRLEEWQDVNMGMEK